MSSVQPYIFTTLRYHEVLRASTANTAAAGGTASAIYLLAAHFHRLLRAGDAIFDGHGADVLRRAGLPTSDGLERAVCNALPERSDTTQPCPQRVRLQCDEQGRLSISFAPLTSLSLDALFPPKLYELPPNVAEECKWRVVVDQAVTTKSSGTRHKTHDRTDYDQARKRAGIQSFQESKEVLLCDAAGLIIDGSITTPYLLRNGVWTTPASDIGGQQGTTRAWALEHALCVEGQIHCTSLAAGETVWLSNAARGFFPAIHTKHRS